MVLVTMLVMHVTKEAALGKGQLVLNPVTKEVEHYSESKGSSVSTIINTNLYLFSTRIFSQFEMVELDGSSNDEPGAMTSS